MGQRAEAITASQASRKKARKLDDRKLRLELRKEGGIWAVQYEKLNAFERLVRDGEIMLPALPPSIVAAQPGNEVFLEGGSLAYHALLHLDGWLNVNTTRQRHPSSNTYQVIFQGSARVIEYRDPQSAQIKIGTSSLLYFLVLQRQRGNFDYTIAFYDPRNEEALQ